MRFQTKLLLFAFVALLGILFWQSHPATPPLAPTEVAFVPSESSLIQSPQSHDITPALKPALTQSVPVQASPDPFEQRMALIHLKLRRWLEAQKNANEDAETQSMLELQAMLTDENAAQIIQSLSTAELETPFGLEGISHWMNANPVQASNWIASRPGATQDETGVVAQAWSANRDSLQDYLDQLPGTPWKQSFLNELTSMVSENDPAAAVKLAQQMTPGSNQASALQLAACNWTSRDPQAAFDWIMSVNDPSLREPLIAAGAQSYALTDPGLAAKWLTAAVKSDGILNDATLGIAQTWVTQNSAEAANWVSQFPEGDTKAAAVGIVSQYWQQIDLDAATKWIQNLSGQLMTPTH